MDGKSNRELSMGFDAGRVIAGSASDSVAGLMRLPAEN